MGSNIVVIGASGAIGNEFVTQLAKHRADASIHAFSRTQLKSHGNISYHSIDYTDEESIADAATQVSKESPIDLVIVATGILHDGEITPEKSLSELSYDKFEHIFKANTFFPAIIAKHFLAKLNKDEQSIFAVLSARVGSISDNKLGGWYSYRASKAALNMIIKNAAIENKRKNKQSIVVALHPGTVDSQLSKPFQKNVPKEKLFSPEFSVNKLLEVMSNLTPEDSGKCFAWDGNEIEA